MSETRIFHRVFDGPGRTMNSYSGILEEWKRTGAKLDDNELDALTEQNQAEVDELVFEKQIGDAESAFEGDR